MVMEAVLMIMIMRNVALPGGDGVDVDDEVQPYRVKTLTIITEPVSLSLFVFRIKRSKGKSGTLLTQYKTTSDDG